MQIDDVPILSSHLLARPGNRRAKYSSYEGSHPSFILILDARGWTSSHTAASNLRSPLELQPE